MVPLEEQIQELLNKLQNWEDIDPLYTDEETKEIRHKIFHVHARTEVSLEIILANHLLSSINNTSISDEERLEFRQRFTQLAASTDFAKKVKSVQESDLLESALIGKMYKLNDLRVIFSHPSAYQDKIREYRNNPAKELETLQLLEIVYEGLNDFFAKSMGLTEKQREKLERDSKEKLESI